MEDPNMEEWRIQEFRPLKRTTGTLNQIWNSGLNLGKKIALTGIVASAAPLALPPLVILSAFGFAFTVPFGFYYASYAVTEKLMTSLLSKPKPPPPPLLLKYKDEELYEYFDGKGEEEGYEEYYDLEEEEKVMEDDISKGLKLRVEFEEENNEFQDVGIDEDVKDIGVVLADEFEEDGYEEDAGEYMEKEEPVPSPASKIVNGKSGNGQVEEELSLMEDGRSKLGYGDVEPEDLEREKTGMVESIRDNAITETENHEYLIEKKEPIRSVASEILKGIHEAEDEISRPLAEVGVVSAEVGGDSDTDVQQVQKVEFSDVEPQELKRETIGKIESIRDEGLGRTKNLEHSMEKEEPIPSIASEILEKIGKAEKEISLPRVDGMVGNDVQAVSEVGRENDFEFDVFGPQVSMEDSRPMVKFGDVGLEELERETTGTVESVRDERISETKNHEHSSIEKEELSEILEGIQEAEEELSLSRKEGILGNDIEAVVLSAEVGGKNDIDVQQVQEVDVFGPKAKFGDVKPDELQRETTGMIESIRDEGRSETKNHEHPTQKASRFIPDESCPDIGSIHPVFVPTVSLQDVNESEIKNVGIFESVSNAGEDERVNHQLSMEKISLLSDVDQEEPGIADDNFEQLQFPSEKKNVDNNNIAGLQEFTEPVSTIQDKLVSIEDKIQDTRDNAMFVIPEELEPVRHTGTVTDITGDNKDLEGEILGVDKKQVRVKKLVVHVKKTGNNKATNIREETVICVRADTSRLNLPGQGNEVQDDCSQSADEHPAGMYLNSGDMKDANASTSIPIEGVNNEDSIWKQINAMRKIVGYEAPLHESYVEELKALYVFTGVEPPVSFMEPTTMADVNEKLQFIMQIVGVK